MGGVPGAEAGCCAGGAEPPPGDGPGPVRSAGGADGGAAPAEPADQAASEALLAEVQGPEAGGGAPWPGPPAGPVGAAAGQHAGEEGGGGKGERRIPKAAEEDLQQPGGELTGPTACRSVTRLTSADPLRPSGPVKRQGEAALEPGGGPGQAAAAGRGGGPGGGEEGRPDPNQAGAEPPAASQRQAEPAPRAAGGQRPAAGPGADAGRLTAFRETSGGAEAQEG